MENSLVVAVWICVVVYGLFRFAEDHIRLGALPHARKIISFIVGAMIPIIFLELLKDTYENIHETNDLLALFLPLGAIISYIIERHIYGDLRKREKLHELHNMYLIFSSVFAFIIGMIFIDNLQETLFEEILFLITFLLFHLMSSIYMHHIDDTETKVRHTPLFIVLLLAFTPVYGVFFGTFVHISEVTNTIILALFSGAYIHVVVDDVMAEERKTHALYFVGGATFFSMLYAMSILLIK